jgi:hypothetical protein
VKKSDSFESTSSYILGVEAVGESGPRLLFKGRNCNLNECKIGILFVKSGLRILKLFPRQYKSKIGILFVKSVNNC